MVGVDTLYVEILRIPLDEAMKRTPKDFARRIAERYKNLQTLPYFEESTGGHVEEDAVVISERRLKCL